jgi:hypothetical protein
MPIAAHGIDELTERRLFSLALPSAGRIPSDLDLQSRNFVCLLAWDARHVSADSVSAFVTPLLRGGASYLVCWGPGCERVHDVIDQMVSRPGNDFGVPNESCIMTTWHDSEPLDEAIWFFLVSAWPDDHYVESTRAALAISVGSPEWASAISSALEDVRGFVQRGSSTSVT